MFPTGLFQIFAMIFCFEMCTCRYVVPDRPPVEISNPDSYHPEAEFRDHALRVGNIIADLLRSEIRLMLKINSTIANGKKHSRSRDRSEGSSSFHHESEDLTLSEERRYKETKTTEESINEINTMVHHNEKNQPHLPTAHPKITHETSLLKEAEKESVLGKSKECVCPAVVSDSAARQNTLMLEQNIYGASSSADPLDSSSPLVVQKFLWNPQNVSQVSSVTNQEAHGQKSSQVLYHPGVTKPSTSTTMPSSGKIPIGNLNHHEHNTNLHSTQTVSDTTTSSTPTAKKPAKRASYNPLAGLEETTETNLESINPLDLQEEQGIEQQPSDALIDDPSEVESQSPAFELVETTMTDKPSEEVKEEVIDFPTDSED